MAIIKMFPHARMRSAIVSKSRVFTSARWRSAWELFGEQSDRFRYRFKYLSPEKNKVMLYRTLRVLYR